MTDLTPGVEAMGILKYLLGVITATGGALMAWLTKRVVGHDARISVIESELKIGREHTAQAFKDMTEHIDKDVKQIRDQLKEEHEDSRNLIGQILEKLK